MQQLDVTCFAHFPDRAGPSTVARFKLMRFIEVNFYMQFVACRRWWSAMPDKCFRSTSGILMLLFHASSLVFLQPTCLFFGNVALLPFGMPTFAVKRQQLYLHYLPL